MMLEREPLMTDLQVLDLMPEELISESSREYKYELQIQKTPLEFNLGNL